MTLTKTSTIVGTAMLLAMAVAPAFAQDASSSPFDGFYVGAEIGGTQITSKTTVTPVTGAAVSTKADKTNTSYAGFVGFGKTLKNGIYLGTELEIGTGAGESDTVVLGGIRTQARNTYQAALTTRLGYMVSDSTMLYATVGSVVNESKFTIADNKVRTVTSTGTSFGLGLMQECTDNIFIRAELERTDFKKKTFAVTSRPTTRYEPEANVLSIGIGYRF